MNIDIPDDLNRRLKQLAKGTGQDVDALVCEAIWERFEDASLEIPDEELGRLPTDGSLQHDHYIYGTPKRPV